MFERNPFLPTDYSVDIRRTDQEPLQVPKVEKQPFMVENTPIKQPSLGQNNPPSLPFLAKSSTMKPVEQVNPFADIGNSTQEQDMKFKTLQMGRERLDQQSLDTWSGVMGVTPTKRWYEEDTRLTQQEQEVCVKSLLEVYDTQQSRWFKKFIGEDSADLFMNRVITNVLRE